MRPICFCILMVLVTQGKSHAQDPVATALMITDWPDTEKGSEGLGWSVFSRQYYGVSNWNLTGISVDYFASSGQSTALISRDGIPGFSWYHLYLSHSRQFKKISGMLQLRFSWIDLKDRPLVFRLGGNVSTTWTISQTLKLQVSIFDFPGWILPAAPLARGDPAMQFMFFHESGRLIGLATGFRLNQSQFGPVTAGIQVNVDDRMSLTGLLDVLPFGISFGINYRLNGYALNGWLGHRNGMGMTPVLRIRGD